MRTILFATLLLVACGSPKGPTDTDSSSGAGSSSATGTADAPTGGCVDDPPVLVVGNGTMYTFTSLSYAECDSEAIEATAVPLPDGGLIPGASLDVPLPGPGCYTFGATDSNGCEGPWIETGALAVCERFSSDFKDVVFGCPDSG